MTNVHVALAIRMEIDAQMGPCITVKPVTLACGPMKWIARRKMEGE